ncbi:metallo-dependent phosphatase [Phanerochaete sordida]|uniref:Metallo-dependent phosphatase n=1 Tax=Phanerochaete sordida TaxID=48140 RepID=A0A9P3GAM1_9APHY|nr:metallo-dependent phosphatase [Phanerochaete sordida]
MVSPFARLGRFLRSIFAPTVTIFGFSCLLTFIFVLYQPHPGPGALQRLGWQAWDRVDRPVASSASQDIETTISEPSNDGVDWWNVTYPESAPSYDPASLPLDVWDPIMQHDTGLSEIEVTQCFIDPWFMPDIAMDLCAPSSTKGDDAAKGKWVQVAPNVNKQGLSYMNVWYRRTRRLDIPLITDIRVLPEHETPSPFAPTWYKVSMPISPRGQKLFLWYNKNKTLSEMSQEERQNNLITELDVTFGDDAPWYGFEKLERPVGAKDSAKKLEDVWLTIRRGVKPPPRAGPLHFSHDGKFKVMQIADLHFSVNQGDCRDMSIECDPSGSDNMTLSLLASVLDKEKPDLVVFTGDQLNGQTTSWDARSVLAKFARTVTERQIPWAAIFGNHDDEDGETRLEQVRYMQGLPYSLVEAGPKDIHGVGNYVLKVFSADPSKTHLLTLYFLDSGAYEKSSWDFFGFTHSVNYDWIHTDQINWFLEQSSRISPIVRPFMPDNVKDLGGVWKRQGQITPETRLAKPNAMMFFHIPLQEAYAMADLNPITKAPLDVGLHGLEPRGSSTKQDGFYHKGVLQALETDHTGGGHAREVKVIANGHCHITDNCRRVQGVWNCFGGGGSYSGYSKIGFDRRFRIYSIEDYGETIRTWKHTEHIESFHWQTLVGPGGPPPYEGP